MTALTMTLDDLPANSVLAAALCDERGQVLLPAGATLTAAAVASLRRRGIERAEIVAPDSAAARAAAESPEARRERIDARLRHLFRHARARGDVNPLMHIVPDYRMGGMQ